MCQVPSCNLGPSMQSSNILNAILNHYTCILPCWNLVAQTHSDITKTKKLNSIIRHIGQKIKFRTSLLAGKGHKDPGAIHAIIRLFIWVFGHKDPGRRPISICLFVDIQIFSLVRVFLLQAQRFYWYSSHNELWWPGWYSQCAILTRMAVVLEKILLPW